MSSVLSTQPAPVPVPNSDDLAPEDLTAELEKLSLPQAAAMEILLRGGTVTAAAQAAGVSRKTLYQWLDPSHQFGQVHTIWKRGMAETARTRLLMLAEGATNVIATAIHRGDTKTSVKLLTGMGILSSPPVADTLAPINGIRPKIVLPVNFKESRSATKTHNPALSDFAAKNQIQIIREIRAIRLQQPPIIQHPFCGRIPPMPLPTKPDALPIDLPLEAIAALCRKYQVEQLGIFGSVLRDDFRPDSDVDFLVRFQNNDAGPWMGKFTDLENDLSKLLGRKVDVVDQNAVEKSENYLRRRHILNSVRTIYVA
jgi:predicted nucleotidyltransferase